MSRRPPSPPPDRRRLKGTERREQILHAATRCFAHHGYRGATTKRIASEADVAEALIYRHFGSKKDLFTEVIERTADFLIRGLSLVLEQHAQSPLSALRAFLELYQATLTRHQDLARMIFSISADLDDDAVRSAYLPHQHRALGLLTDQLSTWQAQGFVKSDLSPRALSWLFVGAYQTMALMQHTGQLPSFDLNEALRLAQPFLTPPPPPKTKTKAPAPKITKPRTSSKR